MTHAMRIHQHGGPEVLRWEEVETPRPGNGEVLVRHTAVGLNFIDTYHRSGLYPVELPAVVGMEAAGVVEAVGEGVTSFAPGRRVAYCGVLGAYAERAVVPAERLVPLPAAVPDEVAAASLLKGLTAWYLVRETYPVKAGETILVHAAAGGVGSILCQWAVALGATVIGTAGGPEKGARARELGCAHVIDYRSEGVVERVREITAQRGVPVAYDGVGEATFEASLGCLAPRGLLVSYGNASGAVPPFSLLKLSQMGSLYVTRPTLATYTASREDLLRGAGELFQSITGGQVRIDVGQRYPLAEAARAHRALEGRRTVGSTVLVP